MLELKVQIDDSLETIKFEHSLLSLSKWEEEHEKPFFLREHDTSLTIEEMRDYFAAMVFDHDGAAEIVSHLTTEQELVLANHINSKRTASTVRELPGKPGPKENVTSELIYYWMISFEIPFQPCETWHLNRLLMLIKILGVKKSPPKKMSASQAAAHYRELNEQRKRKLGTTG